ncbi:MAG TPA: TonB-dependent receptor [Gammaproteobacteria bacterium]|nr:TonB-dependent receptor [Gammaproteobacteria bacterium]
MGKQRIRPALLLAGAICTASAPAAAPGGGRTDQVQQLGTIEVVGVVPGSGVGVSERKIPGNVQGASGQDIQDSQSLGLGAYLNRHMGSVFISEAQDNPWQPNVSYRGYAISPLLGLPQGLAVYQDGVRINEPFGATVDLSLVPQSAIANIELMPGANPVFGRNALGGALSIQTKSGFSDAGIAAEVQYGSYGRRYYQGQIGGQSEHFGYFATAEYFSDDGWRDFSPSGGKRAFGKLSWRNGATRLNLSLTAADTDLIGNGSLPVQLLRLDRSAIFTRPDETRDTLRMVNLSGRHQLSDDTIISGNLYFRRNDIDTLNGDDSDFAPCERPAHQGLLCAGIEAGEEEVVYNARGGPVEATAAVIGGTSNTSSTEQDGYGAAVQVTFLQDLFGEDNHLVIGAAVNRADIDFHSQTELAHLDDTRLAVGSGILDRSSFVSAAVRNRAYGVYFTDTWSPTSALAVTASGRYNHSEIEIRDRLGTALDGAHSYSHFNPALGATFWFTPALGGYVRYSVSSRTPEAVELTCADPDAPCRLPNDFVSDPDLKQIVARSQEIGVRGRWSDINATLAVFRTVNHDDIRFISAGTLMNTGYFKNVGETLRQGIELTLKGHLDRLQWFLDYTWLQAEFRDSFIARSPHHPLAGAHGAIQVESGDRIPVVPRHMFKVGGDFAVTEAFSVGANVLYFSDRFLRGDESNQLDPVSGYTLVNVHADLALGRYVEIFGQITNLFDRDYVTFGTLGDAGDVLGERSDHPRFLSPGAPREVFVGVRVSF